MPQQGTERVIDRESCKKKRGREGGREGEGGRGREGGSWDSEIVG